MLFCKLTMRLPATTAFILLFVVATSATSAPGEKHDTTPPAKPEIIRVSEKRSNLLLFQAGGEVFAGNLGKSELTAIAVPGTVVSTDEGRVVLHIGRLLVLSGKTQVDIGMRLGTIRLARDSSALIEVRLGKPVPVMCTGGRAAPVKIRTRGRLGQFIWLQPSEELLLSDRVLPAEAGTPADGLERKSLPVSETGGLAVAKNSLKLGEFIKSELKNPGTQASLGSAHGR